jgi:HK97 family phage portal protein
MGLIANALQLARPGGLPLPIGIGPAVPAGAGYEQYARDGYSRNELVFACIDVLATSAGEPHIIGRRSVDKDVERVVRGVLQAKHMPRHLVDRLLFNKGVIEEVNDHPVIQLLNRPNPFMTRSQMWGTVRMDRALAGNSFWYKARNGGRGKPVELWRMRPDKVKIEPDRDRYIKQYVYRPGGSETKELAPEDVMHFKNRHPLNEFYGMPPLMPIFPRVSIDNYMEEFVGTFFRNAGIPGGVLTVKRNLKQEDKDEIRNSIRRRFAGPSGWFNWVILDNTESTYTPTTMALGQRGLVVPELNDVNEARICMGFGVPLSIVGALSGQEASSYANKRQDWQVFWDMTMTPALREDAEVLNLNLVPEFGGLDEVAFDLSDIKALQEDSDKLHARARANVAGMIWTQEEGRAWTGVEPEARDGYFMIPSNVVPVKAGELDSVQQIEPAQLAARLLAGGRMALPAPEIVAEPRCPTCDRRVGANIQVGGELHCPRCKAEFTVAA